MAWEFLLGRPFGGCAILYRKCLTSCIYFLETSSNRFCAVKFCDSTGFTSLLISIYMPADSGPSSYTEFLNTMGELEGFGNHCDNVFIVGDFNVNFDRSSSHSKLLCEFMSNRGLVSCDFSFRDVKFTYERDDGLCRSWIDHILCSQPSFWLYFI